MFSTHRKQLLALKKAQMVKITPLSPFSATQWATHPPPPPLQQNLWFPHPLKAIWKTLSLVVSKLDFACTGSRLFPGRWGYEFAFEFMNLLLKIKGGRQKTKFYFFYSLKCFFHWDSLHAGMDSHYKACSYKKNKNKKEKHTGNLFRKNLQLIGAC